MNVDVISNFSHRVLIRSRQMIDLDLCIQCFYRNQNLVSARNNQQTNTIILSCVESMEQYGAWPKARVERKTNMTLTKKMDILLCIYSFTWYKISQFCLVWCGLDFDILILRCIYLNALFSKVSRKSEQIILVEFFVVAHFGPSHKMK